MITNAEETPENILCNPEITQFHTIKNSNAALKADWTSDWEDIIMVDNVLTGMFVKEFWQRQMESTKSTYFHISVWLSIIIWYIIWNTYYMQETPRYILWYLKQKNTSTKQNYTYDPTSQFKNLKECTEVGRRISHWNYFHSRTSEEGIFIMRHKITR